MHIEVALEGVAVALIAPEGQGSPTPRELLQLSLRDLRLRASTRDGHATKWRLNCGSIALDNLLPRTDNPVMMTSRSSDRFFDLQIVRMSRDTFDILKVDISPVDMVVDLALLKALAALSVRHGAARRLGRQDRVLADAARSSPS